MTNEGVVRAVGFGMAEMVPALDRAGKAFFELLRIVDPGDADRQIPGMDWTVGECTAHVIAVLRRGMRDRRRADSVEGLAQLNDETIAEITERDLRALGDMMEKDLTLYVQLLGGLSEEDAAARVIQLHAGVESDIPTGLSYQLFDFVLHGLDIARAVGRPWPIEPEQAALIIRSSLPAFKPWIRDEILNGPPQRTAFTFAGADTAFVLETGEGTFHAGPTARAAAQAEVDPVEMLLALSGRAPATDPAVAAFASWLRPI